MKRPARGQTGSKVSPESEQDALARRAFRWVMLGPLSNGASRRGRGSPPGWLVGSRFT
jgi:hypothetical protein